MGDFISIVSGILTVIGIGWWVFTIPDRIQEQKALKNQRRSLDEAIKRSYSKHSGNDFLKEIKENSLMRAEKEFSEENFGRAIKEFRDFLGSSTSFGKLLYDPTDPRTADVLFKYAKCCSEEKMLEKAKESLDGAIQLKSDNPDYYLLRSKVLKKLKHPRLSDRDLKKAEELKNSNQVKAKKPVIQTEADIQKVDRGLAHAPERQQRSIVLIGIPDTIIPHIFWVDRDYRTHPWSHIPGGCDVIVVYHDGNSFGYDWIKKPSRYVPKIEGERIEKIYVGFVNLSDKGKLNILKLNISEVYARRITEEDKSSVPFEKIWDSKTATQLPWELLKSFDIDD